MNYTKTLNTFKSNNNNDTITYYIYTPVEKIRGILQISHGMCEYIERYEDFIGFLTSNGILVCGNDHLGHGNSISGENSLGYFSKRKGYKSLVEDLHTTTLKVKEMYPDVPFYLLGHSMGSFVARNYITKYGDDINGIIISGTSAGNIFSGAGIFFSQITKLFKGAKYRSRFLNNLLFNNYNKKYENTTSTFDWLSKDKDIVNKYENDPHCNFIFTASGFEDLIKLTNSVSTGDWYKNVPKDLPILLVSGDMDPVGNYGKGVNKVFKRLKSHKVEDIQIKLYPSDRHEILNETDKAQVYSDILKWIYFYISNKKERYKL